VRLLADCATPRRAVPARSSDTFHRAGIVASARLTQTTSANFNCCIACRWNRRSSASHSSINKLSTNDTGVLAAGMSQPFRQRFQPQGSRHDQTHQRSTLIERATAVSGNRFISLIQDFCRSARIADAMGIVNGGTVEAHGVQMSIMHVETTNPPLVMLFCDMGERPRQSEGAIYTKLLQKNFYLSSVRGPSFSIDPTNGRVCLVQACDLDALTPELLAERLSNLANEANGWHYLPSSVAQIDDALHSPPIAIPPASSASSLKQIAGR
jgi:hypothetical protein